METYSLIQKNMDTPKSIENVLESHISNVEKGIFDPKAFAAEMKDFSFQDINPHKCVSKLIDLSKEKITGLTNYKILHNVEKMIDIVMQEYTIKKPGISEVLFFPNKANELKLIQYSIYLKNAKTSISVCMFTINNDNLSEALLECHLKGVKVRIITDDACMKLMGSDIPDLSKEGIQIRTDNNTKSLMHNKFVIIDEKIIITGSYNWTSQATNYNEENIIILENEQMASSFSNEFERLWKQFTPQSITDIVSKDKKKTKLYLRYVNNIKRLEEEKKEEDEEGDEIPEKEEKEIIRSSKKISKAKRVQSTKTLSKKSQRNPIFEENALRPLSNETLGVFKLFFFLLYLFSLFGSFFITTIGTASGEF